MIPAGDFLFTAELMGMLLETKTFYHLLYVTPQTTVLDLLFITLIVIKKVYTKSNITFTKK
jgi:hypothetical protein